MRASERERENESREREHTQNVRAELRAKAKHEDVRETITVGLPSTSHQTAHQPPAI